MTVFTWNTFIHNLYRFAHPITFGDYPQSIKVGARNRLPKFTEAQSNLLKGSIDFLGLNYYTSNYAESAPSTNSVNVTFITDKSTTLTSMQNDNNNLFQFLYHSLIIFFTNLIHVLCPTADKNGTPIGTPVHIHFYLSLSLCVRVCVLFRLMLHLHHFS